MLGQDEHPDLVITSYGTSMKFCRLKETTQFFMNATLLFPLCSPSLLTWISPGIKQAAYVFSEPPKEAQGLGMFLPSVLPPYWAEMSSEAGHCGCLVKFINLKGLKHGGGLQT